MDSSQATKMYPWKEIIPRMEDIRAEATDQFVAAWKSAQSRGAHDFTWHETMGYVIVKRDDAARRIVLSPRGPELLREMGLAFDPAAVNIHPQDPSTADQQNAPAGPAAEAAETRWRPAHARFALRCEPPYLRAFSLERLALQTTQCLQERRRILKSRLNPDEMLLSISQFPLLGAGTYIDHQGPPGGPLLRSQLLPDICLNPLPPFTLEIGGIIDRRGIVPYTGIPVFRDTNTAWPFVDEDLPADPYKSGILMQPGDSGRDSACSMTSPSTVPAAVANVTPTDDAAAAADLIARGLFLDSLPRPLRLNTHTMATLTTHSRPLLIDPPSNKNCVLLDSPLFGIGSGGVLRVTLCAADLNEARLLHDQLAPISAIMAALTAATPIVKGHLVNRDCYWDVQCGTVDDRSAQERGIAPLTTAKGTLLKSRYGSIDMYLGPDEARPDPIFRRQYNDCHFTYDKQSFWKMREDNGIDYLLALHVSRLFVRDIHYASEYMLSSSSGGSSSSSGGGGNNNSSNNSSAGGNMNGQEHFKRFLGCSRQNICLYPPNKCTGSGWEVEFMSLEAQLTDAENAAFITFIVLLSRVIISYRLNLYLPISLMDQNMARAQRVNAAGEQLFFFRRDVFGGRDGKSNGFGRFPKRTSAKGAWQAEQHYGQMPAAAERVVLCTGDNQLAENAEYIELTVDEIMNGSKAYGVTGIINIIFTYLGTMRLEYDVEQALRQQLQLIKRRASGELSTLATWMRGFVQKHPDYRQDSVVTQAINYDMLRTMNDIEEGKVAAPELLG